MRTPIQREQHVEVAGEQGRGAVVEAHQVAPTSRAGELSGVGVESTAEYRVVVADNRVSELLGVRLTRPALKFFEPAHPILERLCYEHTMPDRRPISQR